MDFNAGGVPAYAYTGGKPWLPERPAVVFLHGAANDHSVWTPIARYFANHGRNALALDWPGHGRSAGAALRTVEALSAWLAAALDALGVDEAVDLVGHSMGSLAALDFAAERPLRVRRLALLGSTVPMPVSDALQAEADANDPAAIDRVSVWSHAPSTPLARSALPGINLLVAGHRLTERAAPGLLGSDLAACAAYRNGLVQAARVQSPVLLLQGARDQMTPPKRAAALAAALTRSAGVRTVVLDGAGHSMMAEAPDAVIDALAAFLGE